MTDRNGKPLKVGDKVTYEGHPECSVIVALHKGSAEARGKWGGFIASCNELTLVEPKPEPVGYKGMLDEANEKLRNLTRAVTQYLTLVEPAVEHIGTNVFEALERPDAAELFAKAELVSRVRDIMDGFERSRFSQIADEILKAVAAYHE